VPCDCAVIADPVLVRVPLPPDAHYLGWLKERAGEAMSDEERELYRCSTKGAEVTLTNRRLIARYSNRTQQLPLSELRGVSVRREALIWPVVVLDISTPAKFGDEDFPPGRGFTMKSKGDAKQLASKIEEAMFSF
jgi:hypothetical protein